MLVRTAAILVALASSAEAAPFEHLKDDLATCLRFELGKAQSARATPSPAKSDFALERCETELDRLERADARRLRGDGGMSPSTKSVIQGVLGQAGGTRNVGMKY